MDSSPSTLIFSQENSQNPSQQPKHPIQGSSPPPFLHQAGLQIQNQFPFPYFQQPSNSQSTPQY